MTDELIKELRLQTSILKAAYAEPLAELNKTIRSDKIYEAIVDTLSESGSSVPAADIWRLVQQKVPDAARRTITRRLSDLVAIGAIERRGSSSTMVYESTGLIG